MIGAFIEWDVGRRRSPFTLGWLIAENGCHLWTGRSKNGYAYANIGGRTQTIYRYRYEREIGPIPDGMELDHYVCDGGPNGCCNPHHCRPVTPRENSLRSNGLGATMRARTHCPKGHELVGDNLDKWQAARGGRKCAECNRQRVRAAYIPKKERVL